MTPSALLGATLPQLAQLAKDEGLPPYTARQIAQWLYQHGASAIEGMTNLPKASRQRLAGRYPMGVIEPTAAERSADGTRKYLFPTAQGPGVEAAWIPDPPRGTLCISTQVGCRMGCQFCATGMQGFQGNLTAGEIVNQLRSLPEWRQVTNVVYMGMGEPLDNLEPVLQSLEVLTAPWGMGMSPRRITVSTVGMLPALQQLVSRSRCHLAVSLHSPFHEQRLELMPIQRAHPIDRVIGALRQLDLGGQRRVSFEYILLDGVNDTPLHVKGISRLLNGMGCRVNLIGYHPVPGGLFRGTPHERMVQFRDALTAKGIFTTIRASRGLDIQAACGLLSTGRLGRNAQGRQAPSGHSAPGPKAHANNMGAIGAVGPRARSAPPQGH